MKFIDWFAGIGGFRRGMELAGHECVGFCEWDKFATASYTSMHLITDEQREYLATMDLKKRQKEILKEEYRNGEWYADDIRRVFPGDIPEADCWCFGFPCQDISIAGKQLGLTGNRSSLFFRVMYLVGQLEEEKKPTWLFIENVKNLLSVNRGFDFARLLTELDENGYDAEWCVLNSKDFGVPQNRERCFVIGHFRGRSGGEVFPVRSCDAETFKLQGHKNRNRVITGALEAGDRKTKGTFPFADGSGALKVQGYHYHTANGSNTNQTNAKSAKDMMPKIIDTQGRLNKKPIPSDVCSTLRAQSHGNLPMVINPGSLSRVRRLTTKECFRLQGWTDDYFEKAQFVNSDSQLYKQAGNGVTVNVIEAIARGMK